MQGAARALALLPEGGKRPVFLPDGEDPKKVIAADIAEGLRYTARHPGIGPVMFLLLASSLGTRPFIDLLPGFAASVFGKGPQGLSLMTSTVGLGAMCGGLYLTLRHSIKGLTVKAVTALAVIGFDAQPREVVPLAPVAV